MAEAVESTVRYNGDNMEIQFSSGLVWAAGSVVVTIALVVITALLIKKATDSWELGTTSLIAYIVAAVLSLVMFFAAFISAVNSGIEIFNRLTW